MAEIKVTVARTVVEYAEIVVSVPNEDADVIHEACVKAVQEDNLKVVHSINWELDSDDLEVTDYHSV